MSLRSFLVLLCLAWLPLLVAAQSPAPDARQRLALVVGIGKVGERTVLPSATRDAPAVAAALTAGGYEVLLRENPSAADLRAAFQAFRGRLKPDALGLIYLTGPMAQVDGRNLIVPSDVALSEGAEAPAAAALLRVVGVPVQEALTALAGAPDVPRVLVLDGAYRIAPLSSLVPPGLARQRTPDGTMVLLGHLPAALHDAPAAEPAPADARDPKSRAATRLAKAMADALTLSGVTVAEALRAVRLEVLDASGGRTQPALSGTLVTRVDFAQKKPAVVAAAPAAAAATAAVSAPGAVRPGEAGEVVAAGGAAAAVGTTAAAAAATAARASAGP
ncbi:MAG: caspase family protein, partial [Betaproteobacteria bacterium]